MICAIVIVAMSTLVAVPPPPPSNKADVERAFAALKERTAISKIPRASTRFASRWASLRATERWPSTERR